VRVILQSEEGLTVAKCGSMSHYLKLSPENCIPGTLVAMHGGVDLSVSFKIMWNNISSPALSSVKLLIDF
jgi:hypothetical protein